MSEIFTFVDLDKLEQSELVEIESRLRIAAEEVHRKKFESIGRIMFLQREIKRMES